MESHLLKDYFIEFRRSFFKSTLIFLILLVLGLFNLYNIVFVALPEPIRNVVYVLQFVLALELLFMFIHAFALISRFDMSLKRLLKLSLILANKHFLTTMAIMGILALIIIFCLLFPGLVLFAFGIYFWFSSKLLVRLYRKYLPDMDVNRDIENG